MDSAHCCSVWFPAEAALWWEFQSALMRFCVLVCFIYTVNYITDLILAKHCKTNQFCTKFNIDLRLRDILTDPSMSLSVSLWRGGGGGEEEKARIDGVPVCEW